MILETGPISKSPFEASTEYSNGRILRLKTGQSK